MSITQRRNQFALVAIALVGMCSAPAMGSSFKEFFDTAQPPFLPNGWTTDVIGNSGAFHVVTTDPETPPNCVSCPVPGGVQDVSLYAPPIPITGGFSTVNFKTKFAFDSNANGALAGGRLEISIAEVRDGEWLDPTDVNSGLDGEYVTGGPNMLVASQDNPLAGGGRMVWSGFMNDTYEAVSLKLPAAAVGRTIRLRWRMVSGSDAASTIGWKVDSLIICDSGDTTSNICPSTSCGTGGACGAMASEGLLLMGLIGPWRPRWRRRR